MTEKKTYEFGKELTCSTCKFFRAGAEELGQCRFSAPDPILIPRGGISFEVLWPSVYAHEWCGDYGANMTLQKEYEAQHEAKEKERFNEFVNQFKLSMVQEKEGEAQ